MFVDTYAKIAQQQRPGANAYHQEYGGIAHIKGLADKYHVAIVLVHHTNKRDSDDPYDTISGTTAMQGAADTMIVLQAPRTTKADAVLFVRGRDVEDQELALERDEAGGGWRVLGDAEEFRQSDTRRAISDALKKHACPLSSG